MPDMRFVIDGGPANVHADGVAHHVRVFAFGLRLDVEVAFSARREHPGVADAPPFLGLLED
jgi:hypothetical protein